MMLAPHPDGQVVVTQSAHAWLAAQLARAWGNDRFGSFEPWEEVCLAAEQHDVGMTAWDQSPTLNPATGLPTTFMQMDPETHIRQWTEGPERVLVQSRYAALLTSLHGSALFQGRSSDPRVAEFLVARRAFEERLFGTLGAPAAEVARNQRLIWTWDGMSLGLILGWAPWTALRVPAADGVTLDVLLERSRDVHTFGAVAIRRRAGDPAHRGPPVTGHVHGCRGPARRARPGAVDRAAIRAGRRSA